MDMTLNHPEQLLWVFNNKFLVHAMAPRRAPHSQHRSEGLRTVGISGCRAKFWGTLRETGGGEEEDGLTNKTDINQRDKCCKI